MNKTEAVKAALKENVTCAVYSDTLYTSKEKGIRPLLLWLRDNENFIQGAAVADRIIGRAAAFILIHGGAAEVYGNVMSRSALELLTAAWIKVQYGSLCDKIMNRKGDDICPMEAVTINETDADKAYAILCAKVFS